MFKGALFLALLAGSNQPVFALTSDQVIKSAWSDRSYMIQDELQTTSSKNPLRNVEAFGSKESNGKEEIEYGLKFQFKSWPEWRGNRSRYDEQKLLKESTLSWALRDRYAALTTYDLSAKMIKALSDAEAVADRNVQAQGLALKAGKITSRAYLKAQVDQVKIKRALTAAKEEAELCKKKIKIWIPDWKGEAPSDLKSWSVDEIQSFLQSAATGEKSLSRRIATEELNLLSDELVILRGREDQWLKSIDISQTQKNSEIGYEVGLTLQLPGLGHDELNRQKQNEIILKKALKQKDIENLNDPARELKLQILSKIELYKLSEASLRRPVKPGADPLANIETRMEELQERADLIMQQQQITTQFLDYLVESESLVQEPEKNHLIQLSRREP